VSGPSRACEEVRHHDPRWLLSGRPDPGPSAAVWQAEYMVRAKLDKRPREVAEMFDLVAERYDLLNDVLSAGQDRRWRLAVGAAVKARPGERVLDLAAGTGTVSRLLAEAGADCVACDFSLGMLRAGAARLGRRRGGGRLGFVAGDALALPLRDGVFDVATISFGLRNVADPAAALAEMRRVTKPGGRLLICEFSHLGNRRLDALYQRWLEVMLPAVARRLSPNPDAYSYLAESIGAWPDRYELAELIRGAGWSAVGWRTLSFGVVALHRATN
jgi:demethylmenaquinone methyltransferase / 2-methoxy-6-polyprenyl-1,4-benzoquinol methylase